MSGSGCGQGISLRLARSFRDEAPSAQERVNSIKKNNATSNARQVNEGQSAVGRHGRAAGASLPGGGLHGLAARTSCATAPEAACARGQGWSAQGAAVAGGRALSADGAFPGNREFAEGARQLATAAP